MWISSFSSTICWRSCLFFPMYILDFCVKNHMDLSLGPLFHWSLCLFL
jgi:hypothetical protein